MAEFWEAEVGGWSGEVVYTDWSTSDVIGKACTTCTSFKMTTLAVKCVFMLLFLCWILYKAWLGGRLMRYCAANLLCDNTYNTAIRKFPCPSLILLSQCEATRTPISIALIQVWF